MMTAIVWLVWAAWPNSSDDDEMIIEFLAATAAAILATILINR